METRSRRSRTGIRKESQGDAIFFFTRTDDEQDGWMNMSERVWMDEQTQRTDGWMDERTNAWTDERAQSGYVHTNERTSKRVNERAAGRRLDDRKIGNIAARTRREDLYPDSAEVGTVRSGSPRHDHVTRNALLAIRQTSGRFRPLHPLPRAHRRRVFHAKFRRYWLIYESRNLPLSTAGRVPIAPTRRYLMSVCRVAA